ncbi:class I adenylate-forming enzyme family protein [Nocardioides sambongensis]|uniref:class I adenylate-forming enzyme family protein n=1 Tax=Nocardioides sambongensis TaxID=2589074 RepID=UPI0011279E38|nr:AMP-binding protein [Nocardioides sambongensis]
MSAPAAPDVAALVAEAAADLPSSLAVVETSGRGVTWSELDAEVSRVATGLGRAGIVAGHRVMLVLGNRLEFVTGYLGVLRAQAVAVPVNPGSSVPELSRMIADSGARLVIADAATVDLVRAALSAEAAGDAPGCRLVLVAGDGAAAGPTELDFDALRDVDPEPVPPLPDPEKLAVLLYTSGTSGEPRAAMLSHRALLANVAQVAAVEPPMIRGDDVVLGVLPLFHVYGLNAVLGGVISHRAKLVLADRFDREGTLDVIEDEACSVVPVAPPVFAHWLGMDALAERLGPVRMMLSGSAPLSAETVQAFEAAGEVTVHQGYGLTEASPVVTTTLRSATPKPGSVGTALDGIDLRLVDDWGRPFPEDAGDDPGQIQIRGANLFSGYWPDGSDGPDQDGWWSTGDVGFLDSDGDLFLVDRVKDLIIVSGFNVYPFEVESVIADAAGVRAAAVVGAPEESTGEAVVAYVVPEDAHEPAAVVDAVTARCAEQLAGFKQPTRIEIVDALPRTVTGKVRKGVLRGVARRHRDHLLG